MLAASAEAGSGHPGSIRGSLEPEKLVRVLLIWTESCCVFKSQEAHRGSRLSV